MDWLRFPAALCRLSVIDGSILTTGLLALSQLLFAWNYIFGYAGAPSAGKAPYGGVGHGLMYAAEPWSGHWSLRPALSVVMHTTQFSEIGNELPPGAMGMLPHSAGSFVTYWKNDTAWSVVPTPGNKYVIQIPHCTPDYGSIYARFVPWSRSSRRSTRRPPPRPWKSASSCTSVLRQRSATLRCICAAGAPLKAR